MVGRPRRGRGVPAAGHREVVAERRAVPLLDRLAPEGYPAMAADPVVAAERVVEADPVGEAKGLSQPAAAPEFQPLMVGSIAPTKRTRKGARRTAREPVLGFPV